MIMETNNDKTIQERDERAADSALSASPGYVLMVERDRYGIGFFKDENQYLGIVVETVDIEQAKLFTLEQAEAMINRMSDCDGKWAIWKIKFGRRLDRQNERWKKIAKRNKLEAEIRELENSIYSHNVEDSHAK